MRKMIAPLALLLASPVVAQDAPAQPAPSVESLTLEQATSLRCSVAFAAIAQGQATGDPRATAHPPMEKRGQEFFVRSMARLMDELSLDRAQVEALAVSVAEEMLAKGVEEVDNVMPACLLLLEASGL